MLWEGRGEERDKNLTSVPFTRLNHVIITSRCRSANCTIEGTLYDSGYL
jgi:hypothetical protein